MADRHIKGVVREICTVDAEGRETVILRDEHNTVTDALTNMFTQNFLPNAASQSSGSVTKKYMPIKDLFSGIMAFSGAVDESTVIPQSKEFELFTGCASGFYDGTNVYRGSLNAELTSYADRDLMFVYDYGLTKANGTMKTLCLTTAAGGTDGLACGDDCTHSFLCAYGPQAALSGCTAGCGGAAGGGVSSSSFVPMIKKETDGWAVGRLSTGEIITAYVSSGTVTLRAFGYMNSLGFTDTLKTYSTPAEYETACEGKLENTGIFTKKAETSLATSATDVTQFTVWDDRILCVKENAAGSYTVQTYQLGDTAFTSFSDNVSASITDALSNIVASADFIFGTGGGYLYKINRHTGNYTRVQLPASDLSVIRYFDTVALISEAGTTSAETLRDMYIFSSGNHFCKVGVRFANASDIPIYGFCGGFKEPVCGTLSAQGDYTYINMNIITPSLFTVNVLSSAVAKAPTKTLRIKYEITMEE